MTDVTWWRELNLPVRAIIARDGPPGPDATPGLDSAAGCDAYAELAGRTIRQARRRIVEMLRESGDLTGERELMHAVKLYEKGDLPVEVGTSRQWYIRNSGRGDEKLRDALLERGRELSWHPPHFQVRYENWVSGLAGDWVISRQRFFGVPIPLWYQLDEHANPRYDEPIVPDESSSRWTRAPMSRPGTPPPSASPGGHRAAGVPSRRPALSPCTVLE